MLTPEVERSCVRGLLVGLGFAVSETDSAVKILLDLRDLITRLSDSNMDS